MSDGPVFLTWLERSSDSSVEFRFAILRGKRWSAARTIARGTNFFVNWADFPSLIALPSGRLAAHWLQRSGQGKYAYDVRITQSADSGITWDKPIVPHRDGTANEHGFVSLFPATGDSLGVVWLDGRKYKVRGQPTTHDISNEMMLAQTTIAADGSLGVERRLDNRICDCCQTSMAMTARGPVVVYRDRSSEEIRDISIVRRVDGAWTAPQVVHTDGWKIAACPVNGPSVSANGERVAVTWFTGARDTARVYIAFSDDAGVTFGQPVRVDDGTPGGRVDVEILEHGALVTWIERTGGEDAEVRVKHVTPDGAAAANTITTSTAARASGFPRMVRAGSHVIFAWTLPGELSTVRVARATLRDER